MVAACSLSIHRQDCDHFSSSAWYAIDAQDRATFENLIEPQSRASLFSPLETSSLLLVAACKIAKEGFKSESSKRISHSYDQQISIAAIAKTPLLLSLEFDLGRAGSGVIKSIALAILRSGEQCIHEEFISDSCCFAGNTFAHTGGVGEIDEFIK